MGCASSSEVDEDLLMYLSHSPFFLHLSSSQLEQFSHYFELRYVKKADHVFVQGDSGEEFYVLGEGSVEVTCTDDEHQHRLKQQQQETNGGITSTNDINVEFGGKQQNIASNTPSEHHDPTSSNNNTQSRPPLQSPTSHQRTASQQNLHSALTPVPTTTSGGHNVFLCTKKKGDTFGHNAVLNASCIRNATVTALEDSALLVLTRTAFESYLETLQGSPDLMLKIRTLVGSNMLDSLREISFLQGLDDTRLSLLSNLFHYVTVEAGSTIFEEGDLGRDLYIISEGSVSVSAKSGVGAAAPDLGSVENYDQASHQQVRDKVTGGDMLNPPDNRRTSFSYGTQASRRNSRNESNAANGTNGTTSAAQGNSSPKEQRLSVDTLSPPGANGASSSPHSNTLPSSSPVLMPHHSSQYSSSDMQFATLTTGAIFGEVSLLVDMPRTATVRSITRCLLLVLKCEDFQNFVLIVPDLREKFTTVASARIAQQFRKFNVPFFQGIPSNRFQQLSDLCQLMTFDAGSVVFREGDCTEPNEPAFFLVVSGRLVATRQDSPGVCIATFKPSNSFGEVALVANVTRTATITAETRCVLLSLTKDNFESFFIRSAAESDDPEEVAEAGEQYAEFGIKLSQRLVPLRSVLSHSLGHKLFLVHLSAEFSTENLLFYDAVSQFDILPVDAHALRLASMSDIISHYISPDAPTQVNIPAGIREQCLAEWRQGRSLPGMFDAARNEIYKLMASDSFKRFKDSVLFQQLLDSVGSYDTNPIHPGGSNALPGAAPRLNSSGSVSYAGERISQLNRRHSTTGNQSPRQSIQIQQQQQLQQQQQRSPSPQQQQRSPSPQQQDKLSPLPRSSLSGAQRRSTVTSANSP